ncbi:leucine-rich repeat domain-containing protein [Rhodopirellula sallentina]|uniref:non-specific serine/threonine protein kinase n=1 Tax=Rhodopirellula sallentina SM41 TaxID=1263870 RepID=M5UB47_9BACT|nr:COR domain-containing protein [Rhodopirellula sallentina]EMI55076.1 small GTP-binding protein [Rhodopirellula sallentina SM41]
MSDSSPETAFDEFNQSVSNEIRAVRRSGKRKLKIANIPLEELTPEICTIEGLESLSLSSLNVRELPDWVGTLTDLTELSIRQVPLTSSLDCICNLTNLQVLDISGLRVAKLPANLGALRALTHLRIHSCQFDSLPDSIGELDCLIELEVVNARLATLTRHIGNLQSLCRLDLSKNKLTNVPDELGAVSHLKFLNLSENNIEVLPNEISDLEELEILKVSMNSLKTLPSNLRGLKSLAELDLAENDLVGLPESLSFVRSLKTIDVRCNKIQSLPGSLGDLHDLRELKLQGNRIEQLPESIGKLTDLNFVDLSENRLTFLPDQIAGLKSLRRISLKSNNLLTIPASIGELSELASLDLSNNRLSSLPRSVSSLDRIELRLHGNPIPDSMKAAHEAGWDAFCAFLQGVSTDGIRLYEAKMLLIGEGGVGKTSLVEALLGKEFVDGRKTTHGIELKQLVLDHPDDVDDDGNATSISLNTWDFGGQKVYRVTHQFFYSPRALYVIVWEARRGVENSRVEEWLRHIKMRAGADVRALVVATHCGSLDRVPRIDEQRLRDEFGDVICGFFEVDSKTGLGIEHLRSAISVQAAALPQVGELFPKAWSHAKQEVIRSRSATIKWSTFKRKCRTHKLDSVATTALAGLLDNLGLIVYFGESLELDDLVILKPEWLSKAIGFVLEDKETIRDNGVLSHKRLPQIWDNPSRPNNERYGRDLHPHFLRLMERFDLSYRIDDQSSLVAELVPTNRPKLPWNRTDRLDPKQQKELSETRLVVQIEEDPPGLIPWLIVRNHRHNERRLHWTSGVFLTHVRHGQAHLEMVDRELFITVRSVYPQHFMNLLHDSVSSLIDERWPGLRGKYHMSVPCPTENVQKSKTVFCRGRFELTALRHFRSEGESSERCPACFEKHGIQRLLDGFETGDFDWESEFGNIVKFRDTAAAQLSRLESAVRSVLTALGTKPECPRLFSIVTDELSWIDRAKPSNWSDVWAKQRWRLTLWCEMPDEYHPVCCIGETGDHGDSTKGEYIIREPRKWLLKLMPLVHLSARTLALAGETFSAGFSTSPYSELADVKETIKILDAAVKMSKLMLEREKETRKYAEELDWDMKEPKASGAVLRDFERLLRHLDPVRKWGGLSRVLDKSSGDWIWVCEHHRRSIQPGLPDLQN